MVAARQRGRGGRPGLPVGEAGTWITYWLFACGANLFVLTKLLLEDFLVWDLLDRKSSIHHELYIFVYLFLLAEHSQYSSEQCSLTEAILTHSKPWYLQVSPVWTPSVAGFSPFHRFYGPYFDLVVFLLHRAFFFSDGHRILQWSTCCKYQSTQYQLC